jgi:hypothetical protein
MILPISASQVGRIIAVNQQLLVISYVIDELYIKDM